jgi:DNA-binding response OmpR family regulator
MKAVLEISGFDVDTAASAREGKSRIKLREYQMIITDMRMESDAAGREVIQAARNAPYHPAVALLTAYPEDDLGDIEADKVLVKARQTAVLLRDIEKLLETHSAKLQRLANSAAAPAPVAHGDQEAFHQESPRRPQKGRHQEAQTLSQRRVHHTRRLFARRP